MSVLAVIFDLDGVLVGTDQYHFQSWKELASEIGLSFDQHTYDTRMRGLERMDALSALLERAPRNCSVEYRTALASRKDAIFQDIIANCRLTPMRGVVRLLGELRDFGMKIAVGSSSRNARLVLRKTDLDRQVDAVVDGSEARGKPEPDIFLLAGERLAMPPAACVVVEDSLDGVEAARRAGMGVLAIGSPERVGHVKHFAATLAEVTATQLRVLGQVRAES